MATKNQSAGVKAAATKAANKAAAAVETAVPEVAATAPAKPAKTSKVKAKPEPVEEVVEEAEDDTAEAEVEGGEATAGRNEIADDMRETLKGEGFGVSEKLARAMVKAFEASVAGFLAGGNTVNLPGFGKFTLKYREARQTRNPRTGDMIDVGASMAPNFKCGKSLKDAAAVAFADGSVEAVE